MAGILDMDRSRNRRDRTFVGSQCAVCEEPLEHTLRGERVLQFSCGHVSHEACFYEYIKEVDAQYCPECNSPLGLDSSRGGNVLDLEKLSSIVRSVSVAENSGREMPRERDRGDKETISTAQYDPYGNRTRSRQGSRTSSLNREGRTGSRSEMVEPAMRHENGHWRNNSNVSGGDYVDPPPPPSAPPPVIRRHEYDYMDNELSSRNSVSNPIPPPALTVKSEFPTLSRSKVQQSLTCLVTLEVVGGKWQNYADDLPAVPSAPTPNLYDQQYPSPSSPTGRSSQYSFERAEAPSARSRERELEHEREQQELLASITEELRNRVENWHGLDFNRFGKLRLHGTIKVGKDCQTWQELECYLFSEMLICVKEKKMSSNQQFANGGAKKKTGKCTLKGSILIKKHLKKVNVSGGPDEHILTLNLSVAELPQFHLSFLSQSQLEHWQRALLELNSDPPPLLRTPTYEDKQAANSDVEDDDYRTMKTTRRVSSVNSNYSGTHGGSRSVVTSATEYSTSSRGGRVPRSMHIPLDIVIVIPVSSSMQGLKINLLRDCLRFVVHSLGDKDRLGLVTFGSSGGGVPLTGLTTKSWGGWQKVIGSIRPVGQKSLRADVVEGANVAMDLLMQRKSSNPIASILLISDSSTLETEAVDFVVSRAEAAKITIHSFGLGLTHKPDTMIELSTRTKGLFTYVKDWMMLRECVAGCVGSLQSLSHKNAKLKLKLPEGSPARFVKISGALHVSKRASGREAEVSLGDLRFGDKKDVLVQLVIAPDSSQAEQAPQDAWESIVSGLEALGGSMDQDDQRTMSVEEIPIIQADLTYGDIQRDGTLSQSRPHLLTITMLPASNRKGSGQLGSPPIPPHPMVVQRRMELLTSDMLSRALTLVSRNQHERAQALLKETRTILRGLGKGGLPPLPAPPSPSMQASENGDPQSQQLTVPTPALENNFIPAAGIDASTSSALDAELESALEWINHPAVFSRDSRKAVLQAIGVISSQRGITFRTACESLYAERISGVNRLSQAAREWREMEESLAEED
ncbi:Pleckstrin homology domain-containing protein [Sphaerosporella brunnea]|uniref:Pleckstrin homology domain-containing protein n=1 Tax=Sphaerosporella brunnea TaxID=1250544 RepID=A0A5J5EY35_9PEZI|nr:Pleckstrin homology domain-containing protein [Sphaerosporella brunnea]